MTLDFDLCISSPLSFFHSCKKKKFRLKKGCMSFLIPQYLSLFNGVLDFLVGLRISDGVPDPDGVSLQQQPIVDGGLDVAVELAGDLVAQLHEGHMQR